MKVTVAMPAFNVGPYVDEAVDSVLSQDFRSFELIIVDDHSTDHTWPLIKKYARRPNVRIERNRRNLGAGATRNFITSLARGRYVVPCDADDLLLPDALGRLSGFLDRHPAVGAVYADVIEINTDRHDVVIQPPGIRGQDHRRTWDLIDNVVNHAGSMIRRRFIERVGGYDENVYSVDDWSLWLKLAEISRIEYLPGEIYYVWRRHPGSLTRTDPHWQRDVARIRTEAVARRYAVSGKRLDRGLKLEGRVGAARKRTM